MVDPKSLLGEQCSFVDFVVVDNVVYAGLAVLAVTIIWMSLDNTCTVEVESDGPIGPED